MNHDLMSSVSCYLLIVLLSLSTKLSSTQQTVYVRRGDTAELCDNRTTSIFAYEYRSFDGKKNIILEPTKFERYSNPYLTSVLRIKNVVESDSGLYKCPQDDTEWQKLQVYTPIQHVYLANRHASSHVHGHNFCGVDDSHCLSIVEGESLDVICAADGSPRPAVDVSLDKSGGKPKIMALANSAEAPEMINNLFYPTAFETFRIDGLTADDNGRNITCEVDMKQIDKQLVLSTSKQLYIEFQPTVLEKSKKIYSGINQTRTVNCTVTRANPKYIRYAIKGLNPSVVSRESTDQHDFVYTFDVTPTSIDHFRPFNVTANNSIGFDSCTYELIHGGVPDAITHCSVDTWSSNVTITISCTKSYAQGDNDGYACTLFKYNDKTNKKMFEEIARTKSCIFALENFYEPVEFRIAAFNRYGSLPVNTYGYPILLNQPTLRKETPFLNKRILIILGSVFGGIILLILLCCLCGNHHSDRLNYPSKNDPYRKNQYPSSTTEREELKPITDDTISQLVPHGADKRSHQNGTVYDIPSHPNIQRYSHPVSSTPNNSSAYHQQKPQQSSNRYYADHDTIAGNLSATSGRMHTVSNKFYGQPTIDSKYGPLSPGSMIVPTNKLNFEGDETIHHDAAGGDESPVYSTTTDILSESGSFLVPSSTKRYAPPAPKPRYSTITSIRSPRDDLDKTSLPCPKPRSRSNSRTRLNNLHSDNASYMYEERPASSSDSGIGQSDLICSPNGDTMRTGLIRTGQNTLPKVPLTSSFLPQQARYQKMTSSIPSGTEC